MGEVREADFGLVGGQKNGTIYVDGKPELIGVPEDRLAEEMVRIIRGHLRKGRKSDA